MRMMRNKSIRLPLQVLRTCALLAILLCFFNGVSYAEETKQQTTETTSVKTSSKKKADYTAVDEAIASVPKNLSKYSDKSRLDLEKAILASVQACPECGGMKQAHHVCPNCGMYNGRKVLSVTAK